MAGLKVGKNKCRYGSFLPSVPSSSLPFFLLFLDVGPLKFSSEIAVSSCGRVWGRAPAKIKLYAF